MDSEALRYCNCNANTAPIRPLRRSLDSATPESGQPMISQRRGKLLVNGTCGVDLSLPGPGDAVYWAGGYVVRDANGQALAYLYSRDNEAEARQAKVLTGDEARRIAVNIARLPELLGKADRD
jgi:hypothetical protein